MLRFKHPGRILVLGLVTLVAAIILNTVRYDIAEEVADYVGHPVSCDKVGELEIEGENREVYACIAPQDHDRHIGCFARVGDTVADVSTSGAETRSFRQDSRLLIVSAQTTDRPRLHWQDAPQRRRPARNVRAVREVELRCNPWGAIRARRGHQPELVLVDPELAQIARRRLREAPEWRRADVSSCRGAPDFRVPRRRSLSRCLLRSCVTRR